MSQMQYIDGARRRYPEFEITNDIQKQMYDYHAKLKGEGYEIKAANIAVKDGRFYWILYDPETREISLELYGVIPEVKGEG